MEKEYHVGEIIQVVNPDHVLYTAIFVVSEVGDNTLSTIVAMPEFYAGMIARIVHAKINVSIADVEVVGLASVIPTSS